MLGFCLLQVLSNAGRINPVYNVRRLGRQSHSCRKCSQAMKNGSPLLPRSADNYSGNQAYLQTFRYEGLCLVKALDCPFQTFPSAVYTVIIRSDQYIKARIFKASSSSSGALNCG